MILWTKRWWAGGALRALQIIRDSESAAEDYDAGRPISVVKTPCAAGSGLLDDGVLARVCPGVRWTLPTGDAPRAGSLNRLADPR